jgi:BlaI family penicillinase repressor
VSPQRQPISEAERDVLKTLWELETGTVREIRESLKRRGRTWAPTTVNTLLRRLEAKGLVERQASGFAHVFRPRISREEVVKKRLAALADEYCDEGSFPLVLALVESQSFTKDEIKAFRQLINQLEGRTSAPRTKRKKKNRRKKR